ncbi:beta family protein [Mesorhizobium sp. BR115XR7A]|uniref:beta family protein n=1 Tax=Mesorhizobium sp. BR115XR7A TaxID=2876645 RepID=UPI001CCD6E35|nr:beta family protein [Mesorhizobium sp. BR115XR7A]MBZ9909846.1 beta family protein [Mesorhizobium sp. BR115XR7A]MBZ9933503.1 beta family protein [Mesorhizobium sp. BR1-1-5]
MLPYYPGLRFKQGEYTAAGKLPHDAQLFVEPRFVVPSLTEFDPALERTPTVDEIAHETGNRVGKHWPFKRAFLDTHFIARDLGDVGLLRLFRTVWRWNADMVPVARLTDLANPLFRNLWCDGPTKLAVLVGYEEADGKLITDALKTVGLEPSDCVIFVDFTGAPLDPKIATGSVSGVLDRVGEVGLWQRVVFQGSNFPKKNPAAPGKTELIPRYEWEVFHASLKECSIPPDRLGYGDFGADHGKMAFPRKKGGGRAHRQLRYTTPTNTLVVRGADTGRDADVMSDVCKRIVESEHFAGQAFSAADDRIYCLAKGIIPAPGSASNWREWNTLHHMMRVIRDLGELAGVEFSPGHVTAEPSQHSLFEDNLVN